VVAQNGTSGNQRLEIEATTAEAILKITSGPRSWGWSTDTTHDHLKAYSYGGGVDVAKFTSSGSLLLTGGVSGSATSTGSFGTIRVGSNVGSLTSGLVFGDGDTGFYETSDDRLVVAVQNGSYKWEFINQKFQSTLTRGAMLLDEVSSATNPVISFNGDVDTGMGSSAADNLSLIAGGVEQLRIASNTISGSATSTGSFGTVQATYDINTTSGRVYEQGNSVIDHATAMAIVFGG
jgi:hypothetical protein